MTVWESKKVIVIRLKKDKESEMIKIVRQEIDIALSQIVPPFNKKIDEIKLGKFIHNSDWIKLTYEIMRNVKRSRSEENLSPYREIGITMQVGRNS